MIWFASFFSAHLLIEIAFAYILFEPNDELCFGLVKLVTDIFVGLRISIESLHFCFATERMIVCACSGRTQWDNNVVDVYVDFLFVNQWFNIPIWFSINNFTTTYSIYECLIHHRLEIESCPGTAYVSISDWQSFIKYELWFEIGAVQSFQICVNWYDLPLAADCYCWWCLCCCYSFGSSTSFDMPQSKIIYSTNYENVLFILVNQPCVFNDGRF